MRVQFPHAFPLVHLDGVLAVQRRQLLVGIDRDEDDAAVGVDGLVLDEPDVEVMQHCRLVKV